MLETAIKLIKKIENQGFKAYIVGGFPRDLYLKRNSADIDICTNATPRELKHIFKAAILPTTEYGGVSVIYHKIRFEITTFRREIKYEKNRVPVTVEYIDNLEEDLYRRDFIMNTLCIDKDGVILDFLGAKQDIEQKMIRMVGDPKIRLEEDALRILRAIRFATSLNFHIEENLKKYMKEYGYLLKNLSYYRKKEELDKIFANPNVSYGISLIQELDLAQYLELSHIDSLVIIPSIIGIWSQLDVLDIYNFTKSEKELIQKVNELKDKDVLDPHVLYWYGPYVCAIAGQIKGIDRKKIIEKNEQLQIHNRIEIAITAQQICSVLDRKPGKYLKQIFKDLEWQLIEHKLENDYTCLVEYVLKNYGN